MPTDFAALVSRASAASGWRRDTLLANTYFTELYQAGRIDRETLAFLRLILL